MSKDATVIIDGEIIAQLREGTDHSEWSTDSENVTFVAGEINSTTTVTTPVSTAELPSAPAYNSTSALTCDTSTAVLSNEVGELMLSG